MDTDKFKHKEKYIINLNNDNIEEILLKENVKILSNINIFGDDNNSQFILKEIFSELSDSEFNLLIDEIKAIYQEIDNFNIKSQSIKQWLCMANTLILISKSTFSYIAWEQITSNYLISMEYDSFLELYRRNNYTINIKNKYLSPNIKWLASAIKYTGKRRKLEKFLLFFEIESNLFIIMPSYKENLNDFTKNEIPIFQTSNYFSLGKIDVDLISALIDNNCSLPALMFRIKSSKAKHLENRICSIADYFCDYVIPVDEFADMSVFFGENDEDA